MNFGFNTPFHEQLAFFQQKLNLPSERWDDIKRAAHDRAFIVAGAQKADLLNDLNAAVTKAIRDGKGLEDFRKDFKSIVAKHGWTGWTGEGTAAGEAWRTKVIYQTNMATSYAAGRYQQLTDPEFLTLRPYWRYKHADWVANPRLQHVAWNDLTLPHDHPFWQTHFTPNGWGCHCRVTPVGAREYEKSKAAGKAAPPAGWDEIDAKTDAPKGIAKGFDYAPGANRLTQLRDLVDAKLMTLSPELGAALQKEAAKVLVTSLDQVAADIALQPVEHLVLLDTVGNVLAKQVGSESAVELSADVLSKLADSVLIHNHPGIPQSFSVDDVRLAVWHQLKETHVVDALYHYEIVRPQGVAWGKDYWQQTLAPVVARVETDVVARLSSAVQAQQITEAMRIALTDHMIWDEVNAEVNIGYLRTIRKPDGK